MRLPFRKDRELRSALYRILGFYPRNIDYYKIAFAHKSQAFRDKRGQMLNNERLEFLGDAVLETVVSDILFHHFEKKHEGFLTATRSKIVQRESLNRLAKDLGIDQLVQVSTRNTSHNSHIGGNAFEALMGAVYLDRGYKTCQRFIKQQILGRLMDLDGVANQEVNFKSKLLEWCQKNKLQNEFQMTVNDSDKQKEAIFVCNVLIESLYFGHGTGYSKKEAQQAAAKETLMQLRRNESLVDKIFRSKEKRTAMEANEMAVLPKIDEIERTLQVVTEEKPAKPEPQAPKPQMVRPKVEKPEKPVEKQEKPAEKPVEKQEDKVEKPKKSAEKPAEKPAKQEPAVVAPKPTAKPQEAPAKPVPAVKKATAVALAEAAIADAERTSYLTVISEPQPKIDAQPEAKEAPEAKPTQTEEAPEAQKARKSPKKKVSTFGEYTKKEGVEDSAKEPSESDEAPVNRNAKRASKRAKKLLTDEAFNEGADLEPVAQQQSGATQEASEVQLQEPSQMEPASEAQPITELLTASEVLATETLDEETQAEPKKKRLSKAERIRRSRERKMEAAKMQEQAKLNAAEKAKVQKNQDTATEPTESSETPEAEPTPSAAVPQRKKKQSGNSRTRRRKQAQRAKEAAQASSSASEENA